MFRFVYKNLEVSHKLGTSQYPEDQYSKHVHYQYELIFIVNGSLEYFVDGESRVLKEGDIVLVHPGKSHFADVINDEKYERFVLKFDNTILPLFLDEKLSKQGTFFNRSSKYSIIFQDFYNYYKNFKTDEEKFVLFTNDIIKLCIYLSNEQSSESTSKHTFINDILNYINKHINENISLDTLSKTFMFSKSYISTEFKKHTRTTVMSYIRTQKVIYAHKLILNGEKKSTAAILAGFDEYSTFYRCYTKIIGKNHN